MPKSHEASPFKRTLSKASPIASLKKRRTSSIPKRTQTLDESQRLDDTGLVPTLAPRNVSQDVNTLVRYVHTHMWAEVPERGAGMGSERISEILRFRESLPRVVSMAHLHALSRSSTQTERELAQMVARGAVRKVVIPGRGKGSGGGVAEGIVLVEDWKARVRSSQTLSEELQEKYIALLDAHPASPATPTTFLSNEEVQQLVHAGFFTSPTALTATTASLFAPLGGSSLSLAGTKAATGTLAAVGGQGILHESGAASSTLNRSNPPTRGHTRPMTLSLPSTGRYLKLLSAAREHLLACLKQLSPRYKEATMSLLKEKWDGNLAPTGLSGRARREGEVLPGKTKKWRDFYGLQFEWVLAECVGSGVVEVFGTGMGEVGVRATV